MLPASNGATRIVGCGAGGVLLTLPSWQSGLRPPCAAQEYAHEGTSDLKARGPLPTRSTASRAGWARTPTARAGLRTCASQVGCKQTPFVSGNATGATAHCSVCQPAIMSHDPPKRLDVRSAATLHKSCSPPPPLHHPLRKRWGEREGEGKRACAG